MKWSVVGSGPSSETLEPDELGDSTVLVVNRGIFRVPWSKVSVHLFRDAWAMRNARNYLYQIDEFPMPECMELGIKCCTFRKVNIIKSWSGSRPPLPAWCGEVEVLDYMKEPPNAPSIEIERFVAGGMTLDHWTRGGFTPGLDPIGPQGVQYAVGHGATEVDVWGLEGLGGPGRQQRCMVELQRRILQAVVTLCPDVAFRFHGDVHYPLTGDNVTFIVPSG